MILPSSLSVHHHNNNEMLLSPNIPKSRLLSFLIPKTLTFSKSPIPFPLIPMASSISTDSTYQDLQQPQKQQQQEVQQPFQPCRMLTLGSGKPGLVNSFLGQEFGTNEEKIAKRLEKFKTTIFTQMSMLAIKHGAINLGQGFPNFDGPDFVKEAAIQAIRDGKNQYARGYGVPDLNSAIAYRFKKDTGLQVDPEKEVTVTSGCTEAIAATMLGLINPEDEVILFAPFYDSYEATLSMAGAKIKSITLHPPHFSVPLDELKSTISKNTRAILINTPHNPTGKMFTREELETISSLCIENDILVFSDEVYDKLAFEAEHISIASLPGMFERTVTMNSLGKTFSLTGWKIGWAIAPSNLTWGVRQAHAFLTFAISTPMQFAASTALRAPDTYYEELKRDYMAKKKILVDGLKEVGFVVYPSCGTYFVMVDHTPFGFENDVEFCEYLIKEVGVVAIPPSGFYLNPEEGKKLVRFTFCKDEATLRAAVKRMKERLKKI